MELVFANGVTQLECIFRIFLSCVCGALIGVERSRRHKGAGIRTHVIVALGSAVMMIVSKYGFFDIIPFPSNGFSGDRVAANIITGVSFLGAGIIFLRGSSVKGLTTAAGIWSTAGIGLTVGAGLYILAAVATILILILQLVLHKWHIGGDAKLFGTVVTELEYDEEKLKFIEDTLKDEGLIIVANRFERVSEEMVKITFTVQSDNEVSVQQSARLSRTIPEMKLIEIHTDA